MNAGLPLPSLGVSSRVLTPETILVSLLAAVVVVTWEGHTLAGGQALPPSSANSIAPRHLSGENGLNPPPHIHTMLLLCRYGQCWVFAGVAISMLRALGIASRPVTCYSAAHCVQKLGQVNCYFSTAGELVHTIGRDQIW